MKKSVQDLIEGKTLKTWAWAAVAVVSILSVVEDSNLHLPSMVGFPVVVVLVEVAFLVVAVFLVVVGLSSISDFSIKALVPLFPDIFFNENNGYKGGRGMKIFIC